MSRAMNPIQRKPDVGVWTRLWEVPAGIEGTANIHVCNTAEKGTDPSGFWIAYVSGSADEPDDDGPEVAYRREPVDACRGYGIVQGITFRAGLHIWVKSDNGRHTFQLFRIEEDIA
jgi:hypothetical protein